MPLSRCLIEGSEMITDWVPVVRGMVDNGVYVHAYFNNHFNHFAGHTPGSLELFRRMWG